ncbi:MAG TPA: DUF3592 domain-containing protein [Verrucomicrobiae bacterium]|nr:DUF3592 domain-containing protein [Verrucomicrobiae bacterium]
MHITVFIGLVVCGFWLLYTTRDLILLGLSSYKWLKTEGTIIDSQDNSFTIEGINRTSTGVVPVEYKETAHLYEYVVGGRTYRSSTFCFGGWADNTGAAYLIGTKVSVYYDPRHPEVAVLKRGLQPGALFGLIPIGAAVYWAYLVFRD